MAYNSADPEDSTPRTGTFSADDALPPVEPPSAGFILQLFVIPGVIVTIIVLVWLLFNWLAHLGNDPQAYVEAIKRSNEGRWQAAVNLANALNNEKGPGFKELRGNRKVVEELSGVLQEEIKDGSMEEKPVTFRIFLCKALGSFEVPEGLPALIEAVKTNRDPKETDVRRAALEAIALLAENVRSADPGASLGGAELEATLLAAAGDSDPLIRSTAAYAMGVVGSEPLLARLRTLAGDAYPDVRYNAGTGLARHGDPAATEVLLEMLDPDEQAGVNAEKEEQSRAFKKALIEFNGVRGVAALIKENSRVDRQPFAAAISKLLESKPPKNVQFEAENLLRELKKVPATQAEKAD